MVCEETEKSCLFRKVVFTLKIKRLLAMCLAAVMMVSAFAIPASAASSSAYLTKNSDYAESSALGLYKSGYCSLVNSTVSNDGVNCYLDQSEPGKGWANAKHIFCEPGESMTSSTASFSNGRSWRVTLSSWWPGGINCIATGTAYAY